MTTHTPTPCDECGGTGNVPCTTDDDCGMMIPCGFCAMNDRNGWRRRTPKGASDCDLCGTAPGAGRLGAAMHCARCGEGL